jgi:hypothetical protein
MTGFACCLLYFIKYICGQSFGFIFMTTSTVDFRVLSVQFKCRLIVVKIFYFPDAGCMAARTIRGPLVLKLLLMHICMAIRAVLGKTRKLLVYHAGIVLPEMTQSASGLRMRSGKNIVCDGMIKIHRAPFFIGMTGCTIGSRVIFGCDIRLVYIFMTVNATGSDSSEIPVCLFFMAFKTGNSQVGPRKWKGTQVMMLNCIR